MTLLTRCPGCATVFRVTPAQLALREGQVRCGQCRAVFDANDHVVALPAGRAPSPAAWSPEAPLPAATDGEGVPGPAAEARATEGRPAETAGAEETPAADEARGIDQARDGDETRGIDEARGIDESPEIDASPEIDEAARDIDEARGADAAVVESAASSGERDATAALAVHDEDAAPLDRARPAKWQPRRRLRDQPRALYALALVGLLALALAQLLFEYRDALAAQAPATRPILDAACRMAGCAVGPLREAAALSIEASDLQADPAHKGLLKLTATLRNRAPYPIGYPYLELTLTDSQDAVVARRALPPTTYAPATAEASGIAGNGEVLVSLFLDASGTAQAGYRLYLFYP